MDFDWNAAFSNLTSAWSSIEQSKANLDMKKLDARTTAANGTLYKDGTTAGPGTLQAVLPWALLIGGGVLLFVLVRK